jgi:hypothetical protein
MRTFVSMTTRSRVIGVQEVRESFFSQATCGRLGGDLVPEIDKRLHIPGSKPFVVSHRHDDRDIPVLPANDDRLPLRLVQDGAEPVLRFRCGDSLQGFLLRKPI